MKLKKSAQLTAIVLALLVVLPTAISQLLDRPIKWHQEQLLKLQMRRSDCLQLGTYHQGRIYDMEVQGALGRIASKLNLKPTVKPDIISKGNHEQEQLSARYESGQIDGTQFFQGMAELERQKKQHFSNCVEDVGSEITRLHANPPTALTIKQRLPILQVLGVILVVLINGAYLRAEP